MAQAQVTKNMGMNQQELLIIANDEKQKRKVNLCIGNQHYISVFKTEDRETVINIRKGTRSITLCKSYFSEICVLKETILTCCAFIEGVSSDNEQ